jgi:DNA-directed RNA polymerase omega subunit
LKPYGDIDSKFRFVIVASKRAKQLLKGAKPKLKSKSKNLIRIAQEEVEQGIVDFEIVQSPPDELPDKEDDIFIGEELEMDMESAIEEAPEEAKAEEKSSKKTDEDKDKKKKKKTESKKKE